MSRYFFLAALLLLGTTETASSMPRPVRQTTSVDFAFGDVFALDAPALDEIIATSLEIPSGRGLGFTFGAVAGYGTAYGLYGQGLDPIFFVDRHDSFLLGPRERGDLLVQTLDVVAQDAQGTPQWGQPPATRILVTRPVAPFDGTRPGLSPARHEAALARLVGSGAPPAEQGAALVGTYGGPAAVRDTRVVAHDLVGADLRTEPFVSPAGRPLGWKVQRHVHRAKRDLLRVDLSSPAAVQAIGASFVPSGINGTVLMVQDDDQYDSQGRDLGRRLCRMAWGPNAMSAPRIGFDVPLGQTPLDLSESGARLAFSVAGTGCTTTELAGSLVVALTDASGARTTVPVNLGEITQYEQTVTLPAQSFFGIDLGAVTTLGFSALDPQQPNAAPCSSGNLRIFAPRFSVDSPLRRTPQNVFWSNTPLTDAGGGPGAPLTDSFLGQPGGVFKYFVGVSGPSLASANSVLAEIAAIRSADRTPHVVLELFPRSVGPGTLRDIETGVYDTFFLTLFSGAKDIGGRIELAPLHEANGFWYPWRGDLEPSTLRAAWRRIDALRDAAEAHNVVLAYVVSCLPSAPGVQRAAAAGFPGDDVVDMIGIQGFESGYETDVDTANEVFTATVEILDRLSELPFVLTEYGFYTLPGAQYPKGQLALWSLDDQLQGRSFVPFAGAFYFNVSKFENGAFRNWRLYEDGGAFLNEVLPFSANLEALAADPRLATGPGGRRANDLAHRRHTRLYLRLIRS